MNAGEVRGPGSGSGVAAVLDSLALIRRLVAMMDSQIEPGSPQQVVDLLVEHQDIDGAALRWYQRATDGDAHIGLLEREVIALRMPGSLEESDLHDMLEVLADSALRVDRVRHEPDLSRRSSAWRGSLLVVPVVVTESLFGFIAVWNQAPYRYLQWHMSLLESCTSLLRLGAGIHPQFFAEWVAQATSAMPHNSDLYDSWVSAMSERGGAAQLRDVEPVLYSRDAFCDEVQWQLDQAGTGSGSIFLLHVDIDRFRIIRECGGYRTAERVVWVIADLLRVHGSDKLLLGRLGSDEFGILFGPCSVAQAVALGKTLTDRVDRLKMRYAGQRYDISISIGISRLDAGKADLRKALCDAQAACRDAQRQGGGMVQVFSEVMHERRGMLREGRVLNTITQAMKEERFALFAQPIVATPDAGAAIAASAVYFELLLRILDKDGNLLDAKEFVPIAERYSLSARIDRWVVSEAFRCLSQQLPASSGGGLFAINLSGHSVDDHTFLDFIVQEFARTGLVPQRICFEITETAAISDMQGARTLVHVLKDLGCSFALDDFGSGHSSFLYLRDLPVDYLKIDGALVSEIVRDPVSASFVRSIEDIGKLLGKRTVAEHVESQEILDVLTGIGVDFVQGRYVGKPVPLRRIGRIRGD